MQPRPYQLEGRDFLVARPRALLADEMRVGKTPQAIMAADAVQAGRVLVLCPAGAAYQWREQWADWSPNRSPATILSAEPISPTFQGVAIASYNRAVQHRAALSTGFRWDVLIPDESHYAKNPEAQRTHMVYAKGGIGWNANRIWALSGTPAPNHAGEVWPMLRAFGVVQCSYLDFVNAFCYYDWKSGTVFGNRPTMLPQLRELMRPILLRRLLKDVAPQMPKIAYNLLAVKPVRGVDLRTDRADDVDTEDRIAVATAKAPLLAQEVIDNMRLQTYKQTVVFGFHREPLRLVGEKLTGAGIDVSIIDGAVPPARRHAMQGRFKDGYCQALLVQIIAGGTAVDLSAAQHGYFLELDYVPDNNAQAAHRLVNVQTQLPVTMDVVTWPGTKDDKVQRTLLRKVRGAVFTS